MHVQTDFDSFSFDDRLIRSLREVNVLTPTTLQRAAFAPLLEGRDLALQAGPGTGRVLAWCLPTLSRLVGGAEGSRVVIVTPSGEVAMKIEREIKRTTRHVRVSVLMPAAGVERTGASYEMFDEEAALPDVLVGMPAPIVHFIEGTRFPVDRLCAFVCDLTGPVDETGQSAIRALAARLPDGCQRIVVSDGSSDAADGLSVGLLRDPAFVFAAAGSSTVSPEREPLEEPAPSPPPVQPHRGKPQHGKDLSASPESWPIAHIGVTAARNLTSEDMARIVRVEARGHTVVLVGDEERARALAGVISRICPGKSVRTLGERDALPEGDEEAVTVCPSAAREREELTANVLVLGRFPTSADEYVTHIPMLRCEPGDRIVSVVTPRDVGTQYQLRLAYGIRLLERRLPGDEEMDTMDQADALRPLRDLAGGVAPRDLELLARVRTMDRADEILAAGLARLVEDREGPKTPPARRRVRRKSRDRTDEEEPLIKSESTPRSERSAGRRGGIPMVELELSCGADDGVEADYLAQWLQSRLAMRVSELGPIRVHERRTIVTVPRERAGEASMMLSGLAFGDRKVEVRNPLAGRGKS
jgi:hypothetical protein